VIPLRDVNPTRRTPILTIAVIVACVAVWFYELGTESTSGEIGLTRLFLQFGLVPDELTGALATGRDVAGELSTVLTSMFLHGGWLHLIGNMLYLWIFGNNIEDRFGRLGFVAFYILGGAVAAGTQVLVDPDSPVPVVGASGAIAAILGAYLVLYPRARVLSLVFLGFFYQLLEVPALLLLGFWFVLQLIDGFGSLGAASSIQGGVAFFAHIGGFVAGALTAFVVQRVGRAPDRPGGSAGRFGVG
jgi:membrane associated rhomboid family serine protease